MIHNDAPRSQGEDEGVGEGEGGLNGGERGREGLGDDGHHLRQRGGQNTMTMGELQSRVCKGEWAREDAHACVPWCRAGCLLGVQPAASRKKPAHSKGESLGIRRRRARCELFTTSASYMYCRAYARAMCRHCGIFPEGPRRPGRSDRACSATRGVACKPSAHSRVPPVAVTVAVAARVSRCAIPQLQNPRKPVTHKTGLCRFARSTLQPLAPG